MANRKIMRRVSGLLALGVGISFLASVGFGQPIPLRGPPVSQYPPQVIVTDPSGNTVFTIRAKVALMPGKPPRAPLNNGSITPEFVYDILSTSGGGGLSGGGGGGLGGGGGGLGGGGGGLGGG